MKSLSRWGSALCTILCGLCAVSANAACEYEQAILAEDFQIGIRLTWVTSMEDAHDRFVIEASTDGRRFTEVGQVAGSGTSDQLNEYEFLHVAPEGETLYYRLKEIDLAGDSYEGQVAYFSRAATPAFYIAHMSDAFAVEEMNITLEATTEGVLEYELRHWNGELVDQYRVEMAPGFNEINLPLEHLEAAVYKVSISAEGTEEELTIRKIDAPAQDTEIMVRKN